MAAAAAPPRAAPARPASAPAAAAAPTVLSVERLSVSYGGVPAVREVTFDVPDRRITAVIGPSGCGKSTLLRAMNRMNDFLLGVRTEGTVRFRGLDLYGPEADPVEVRRRIGMVFQRPNPFPKSIYENVAWGPRIHALDANRAGLDERVERALRRAGLWDEVKNRLDESGLSLSGGQQQRLCIARAIAMEPEVILMDEPCSALDPASTGRIEDLLYELKNRFAIVIVTHNMQQAARVSDVTVFLEGGRLVEVGETDQVFTRPRARRTEEYVTGRFG